MARAAEGKSTEAVVAECKEAMSIGTLQFAGKCIVFDAIRAASSDGLDVREKKVLTSIAQGFGIDEGLIAQFVALVEKEQALKAERIALVVPGHPCLLEKYRTQSKKLLLITDSPMGTHSASKKVTTAFIEAFKQSHQGYTVDHLDLATSPAPEFNAARVQNKFTLFAGPDAKVDDTWEPTKALIDQFLAADAYVFASAMWNFGVTYQLKKYIDNIVQPHLTFNPVTMTGMVTGKPALIVAASGAGVAAMDNQTTYLQAILGFIGFTDVRLIQVTGTADQAQLADLLETKSKEAASMASNFTFNTDAKLTPYTAPPFVREETKIAGNKKVLVITSSPMGDNSASGNATKKAIAALGESGLTFEYLDLYTNPAPEFTAARVMAKFALYKGPLEGDAKEEFKNSLALIDQFKSADAFIFAVPMWNLTIPYNLKKYFDNIVQPSLTFDPATYGGFVTGKPAVVVAASGSGLLGNTALDFVTPYMQCILGFMGIKDVQTVFINGTATGDARALIEAASIQVSGILNALI
jgi:FMN-dependent NADH-azoreductase